MPAVLKGIGFLLIIAGSTLTGIVISSSYVKRVQQLLDIKSFLSLCETSMNDIGMHTDEILQQAQGYMKTAFKDFLQSVHLRMHSEYPDLLSSIWEEQLRSHQRNLSLTQKDMDVLKDIGAFLGSTELESQKKQINRISGLIEKHIEDAVALMDKNRKIALNMGASGGLILVLILL